MLTIRILLLGYYIRVRYFRNLPVGNCKFDLLHSRTQPWQILTCNYKGYYKEKKGALRTRIGLPLKGSIVYKGYYNGYSIGAVQLLLCRLSAGFRLVLERH